MIIKTCHPIVCHAILQQVETYVATAEEKRLAKNGTAPMGEKK
jgi:hypothetical protein